jgi:hypothetical protein
VSELFSAATQRLAGFASRYLGWRPWEFWRATPSELMLSLYDPEALADGLPPSREEIAQMIERDNNE